MDKITNILVVGIGGQGVITVTDILAEAAIALGHDVKKSEIGGVAQRGGLVSSHLRFGPRVMSPLITPGTADFLLGLEAAEGMRWQHMLRPNGLALMNTGRVVPPIVELGLYQYPKDPVAEVKSAGAKVEAFDATEVALSLGDLRLANTVMLGAIADHLPFSADLLLGAISKCFARNSGAVQEMNRQAFAVGRAAADAVHVDIAAPA